MRFYAITVWGGGEARIKYQIETLAKALKLEDKFGKILLVNRTQERTLRGKDVTVDYMVFSGYMFVQMEMTPETCEMVRTVPGVMGFMGNPPYPALTSEEVEGLLDRMFEEETHKWAVWKLEIMCSTVKTQ